MGSDFFKRAFSIKEFKRTFSKEGLKQTRQDFKKFGQDVREAGQGLKQVGQELKGDFREAGQGIKEDWQGIKEDWQGIKEDWQGIKEANRELKEAWQKADLVKDVCLDYLGGHPEFPKVGRIATIAKTDEGVSLEMRKKTIFIDRQDVVAINLYEDPKHSLGNTAIEALTRYIPYGYVAIVLTIKYDQANVDLLFRSKNTGAQARYERLNRFLN